MKLTSAKDQQAKKRGCTPKIPLERTMECLPAEVPLTQEPTKKRGRPQKASLDECTFAVAELSTHPHRQNQPQHKSTVTENYIESSDEDVDFCLICFQLLQAKKRCKIQLSAMVAHVQSI